MSEPDTGRDDSGDDARIRALLGSLRAEETLPDDVAARLDHRLGELSAPRRRSWPRRHATLLVAAAAVVVVAGLGVAAVSGLRDQGGGAGSSSSASRAGGSAARADAAAVSLRRASLRADVAAVVRAGVAARSQALSPDATCAGGPVPPGVVRRVAAQLDGRTAVLDLYAARDGSRLARVVACDGTPLAATRVAARTE